MHVHECPHECLHSIQHCNAYKKIYHLHREVEDLINKETINHDSFERTRKVCEDPFHHLGSTIKALQVVEFVNFNKFSGTSDLY